MDFYLFLVIVLFSLAIADLVVGVSNDAVNFLNSAVGSKVAPRYIIMIVASLGIFIGATFSSGIMEVARKGIFNPEYFAFSEVMIIFIAVMLTDIILLDFFNTIGLPTSTTVSIVFELLGAAVVVALIKLSNNNLPIDQLGEYINSSRALTIIAGIFLSVVFAFLIGLFVQYLSRILFSFQYEKRLRFVGAAWSGFALTALTYFMLIKGVKGASFVSSEQIAWFQENSFVILGISFVFWSIVLQIIYSVFKINILKIIVLFGTFGLAMAFAGNDLVNFIGVPIAGYESFLFWKESNIGADEFMMTPLSEAVQTPTYLLLIAGLIMVVTLWLSKKARSVTETEVNLARQSEGSERFTPNDFSRNIVSSARSLGKFFVRLTPRRILEKTEEQFVVKEPEASASESVPAFDLVRASVNLTVASILIAFATSLKLPLSTTYVSFMVAMGTSLADRAWGRDSAVYRVSGVLSVIGGWFMTALIAFLVSGLFALLIFNFEWYAVIGLLALAIVLIIHGVRFHKKRVEEKLDKEKLVPSVARVAASQAVEEQRTHVTETLTRISKTYREVIDAIVTEKKKALRKSSKQLKKLEANHEQLKGNLYLTIKRIEEEDNEASKIYLKVYNLERDLLSSINYIAEAGFTHVANEHNPLRKEQEERIIEMKTQFIGFLEQVILAMDDGVLTNYDEILRDRKNLETKIDELLGQQVSGIKNQSYGSKNSILSFNLLMETRELSRISFGFIKLVHKVQAKAEEAEDL